ncbi:MAG: Dam family site-specific DNA-(adenine-N6)-methyltransferase [Cyanobacteria bacterium]|nr:Dam family site-specific DNA-(adenine-N6)-methyltransferase [Cyanobacteriota bacterium]
MKPFLKWAGNKFAIIHRILGQLPEGNTLIEPFVGSAAVFLNSHYPNAVLGDNNPDLIHLYQLMKTHGDEVLQTAKALFTEATNTEATYYTLRAQFNQLDASNHPFEKAALFIYLNKHGYNGLCRYNQQGKYNVPFGRYKKPYFPEKEMIAFIEKIQTAHIRNSDFESTMKLAQPGDVIYCDPPYYPLSPTANFTSYSRERFGIQEQVRLAEVAFELSQNGVHVVISNHDTPFTQAVYRGASIVPFDVQRNISCRGDQRNKARELLALYRSA